MSTLTLLQYNSSRTLAKLWTTNLFPLETISADMMYICWGLEFSLDTFPLIWLDSEHIINNLDAYCNTFEIESNISSTLT